MITFFSVLKRNFLSRKVLLLLVSLAFYWHNVIQAKEPITYSLQKTQAKLMGVWNCESLNNTDEETPIITQSIQTYTQDEIHENGVMKIFYVDQKDKKVGFFTLKIQSVDKYKILSPTTYETRSISKSFQFNDALNNESAILAGMTLNGLESFTDQKLKNKEIGLQHIYFLDENTLIDNNSGSPASPTTCRKTQ